MVNTNNINTIAIEDKVCPFRWNQWYNISSKDKKGKQEVYYSSRNLEWFDGEDWLEIPVHVRAYDPEV